MAFQKHFLVGFAFQCTPYLQLEEDEDDPSDGEPPRGDHEEPVPDEPLVQLAALGARPVLLEVARQEHAHRGEQHPRRDHEGAVQLHEEVLARRQGGHSAEILHGVIGVYLCFAHHLRWALVLMTEFYFAPNSPNPGITKKVHYGLLNMSVNT